MQQPSASHTVILSDYTPVHPSKEGMEGHIEGFYYSDVTIREFYTKEKLLKHKQMQDQVLAAEASRDSEAVIDKATAEKEWTAEVVSE